MKKIQQILSILLVCCMLLSSLPTTVLAAELGENDYADAEIDVSPEMAASLIAMLTGEDPGEPIKTDEGYVFEMPESMVEELASAVDGAATDAGIDYPGAAGEEISSEKDNPNALPESYVDNSNDALYAMLEELSSAPMPLDSSLSGTKVDLFFVIDSTGSMFDYIEDVKANVAEFARSIGETGVSLRLGLIDYRDIEEDGDDSTVVHEPGYSPWMDVAGFINELTTVSADGGGDTPETPIDALANLVEGGIGWNSDAYKFAMLITDAGYKTNNNHGIADMDEMIRLLQEKGIFVSTITPTYEAAAYGELAIMTGGVQIVLSDNFADDMMEYAEAVIGKVSDESKPTRDYTLRVLDGGTSLPVADATVTWTGGRTFTDESGKATITTNQNPVKNVQVSRDGYIVEDLGDLYEDADVALAKLTVDPGSDADDIPTLTPSMFKETAEGSDTVDSPTINVLGKTVSILKNLSFSYKTKLFGQKLTIKNNKDKKQFEVIFGHEWKGTNPDDDPYWKEDYQKYKSLVQTFSDKTPSQIRADFLALKKENTTKADFLFPVDTMFGGYGEFSYASGSIDGMTGGIIIGVAAKEKDLFEIPLGVPWIFFQVSYKTIDLKAKFALINVSSSAKVSFTPKGEISLSPFSIKGTVNVGVPKLASAYGGANFSLAGKIDIPFPNGNFEEAVSASIKGDLTFGFKLVGWKSRSLDFPFADWKIYPRSATRSIEYASLSITTDDFIPIGRPSAVNARIRNAYNYYQDEVYEDSAPQLLQLPDDSMLLVWVDAVEDRSDANMTALYYSYQKTDGGWSDPALVDDDGTSDFMPTLALGADDTPVLVWQNSKTEWESLPENLPNIASDIELKSAIYDQTSNGFKEVSTLTDSNSQYPAATQVIPYGAGAAAYWIETDPSNLLLGEDLTSIIYSSIWNGSEWGTCDKVTDVGSLDGFAVGQIGSSVCVAYAEGDNITAGGETIAAAGSVSSLQIVDGSLYWSDANGLNVWDGSEVTTFSNLAPQDFTVLTSDSQKAMLIRQYTGDANELYASIYIDDSSDWSNPIPVTEYSTLNLSTPSAVLADDGSIYWVCGRFESVKEGDSDLVRGGSDLVVDSYTPAANITVGLEAYISDFITAGEPTYADVDLNNVGLSSAPISATVQIEGIGAQEDAKIYRFSEIDPEEIEELEAGDSFTAGILFTAPAAMDGEKVTITFMDENGNAIGTAIGNLPSAAPDVAVTNITTDGVTISATVQNIGSANASNVSLSLTQEGVDDELGSETISLSAGGSTPISFEIGPDADLVAKTPYDYKRFTVTAEPLEGEVNVGNNSDSTLIEPQVPTAIAISGEKNIAMKGGEKLELTYVVTPAEAPVEVAWMSSDNTVATVSNDGVVSAWGNGEADIIVSHIIVGDDDDDIKVITDKVHMTVTEGVSPSVGGVSVSPSEKQIAIGGTVELTAIVSPSSAIDKSVQWFVDDDSIVEITPNSENGTCLVKGLAKGVATITVRTNDGAYTAQAKITVSSTPTSPAPSLTPSGSMGSYASANTNYQISVPATSGGRVTVSPTAASAGTKVTITAKPNAHYTIGNVAVTDSSGKSVSVTDNGNGTYSFTMPAFKVTINVTFVSESSPDTSAETPWVNPFSDVSESDWFYGYVAYVTQHGLMGSMGDQQFIPSATTTRGMLMTILARMNGIDTSGSTPWYQAGMDWAIGEGVSDGTDPEGEITREQLATMLWRYAGQPAITSDLSGYPDAGNVSDWAIGAMVWAVQNGIINGSDGKLEPQGNAIRSQAAAMLTRFCQNIER